MTKATFAVRIPSTWTVILCVDGTLYGFCDMHGENKEDFVDLINDVRGDFAGFYNSLWADEASQRQLQAELDKATDAIRFDY